jgi:GT2 family glycosyltransferase
MLTTEKKDNGFRLTVIVPASDLAPQLPDCIERINSADEPPEELLVIRRASRPGPAAARNAGARRASGGILVFVDSDVMVHYDAFSRIRRAFSADTDLAAVFGSYDEAPAAPGTVSRFRNLLHHHVHQAYPGRAQTFWAGLGAVRRDVFLQVGGFDDVRYLFSSIEDVELGRRLQDAGAKVVLDPRILGTHLKSWTLRSMLSTDLNRRAVPWVVLACEERRLPATLNLGWRHRLSALACVGSIASAAGRRPRLALGALAVFTALNWPFYRLLARCAGPRVAMAGPPLHLLHHLAAIVGVPVGVAAYASRPQSPPRVPR